jgi:hypothetical protein
MFPSFATQLVVVKGTGTVREDDDFAVALFRRLKDARDQAAKLVVVEKRERRASALHVATYYYRCRPKE